MIDESMWISYIITDGIEKSMKVSVSLANQFLVQEIDIYLPYIYCESLFRTKCLQSNIKQLPIKDKVSKLTYPTLPHY